MPVFFEEIRKNFGFGCMRLPMKNDEVDYDEFCKMIDYYMENGFNYYDTAHMYIDKKSEPAIRECLAKRYPRESFVLTDKLSENCFKCREDIRPLLDRQLEICGVDYFDFYLMHAQNAKNFEFYKKCKAYETALELKKEGKIRHMGISFHDSAQVLDKILTEYPEVEAVQLQFNYVDYDDNNVQGRECYEVCRKHNKPVIVMEPVKGGHLVNIPTEAEKIFNELNGGSYASYAIRFAAGFDNVMLVISGMSNMEQMIDNITVMKNFKPLTKEENNAVIKVAGIIKGKKLIPCTACKYCTNGCPKKILIPDLFSCLNSKTVYADKESDNLYNNVYTVNNGKASDCIGCGKCEKICPQHLPIRDLLKTAAETFE